MIDRIEELLRSLAADDDEKEQQEDAPALTITKETVPASPHGNGGETGSSGTENRSGGQTAGEVEAERAETAGELWKDGPVWTVRGGPPEIDEAQKAAQAGRTAQAEGTLRGAQDGDLVWAGLERAARGGAASPALEGAGRSGTAQTGLEGLYRQTVRGLRPAAPALPP